MGMVMEMGKEVDFRNLLFYKGMKMYCKQGRSWKRILINRDRVLY